MDLVREKLITNLKRFYILEPKIKQTKEGIDLFLKFLLDKRNAAFGDSLINFIYSCGKSLALKECTGIKISDSILLNGFYSSEMFSWLKLPGKKKDQANALESLIFYVWLNHNYTIEEMALTLLAKMDNQNLKSDVDEHRFASSAFTDLFNSFNNLLLEK